MIPTYNCAAYLRETLASVLSQDPGPERMQIEVVDDCSTKDDPEAVVQELGGGRVGFHRHPHNLGLTGNFNACLARSRGEWVHLLHGDDCVLPGFYQVMGHTLAAHPEVALAFCRSFTITEHGDIEILSPRTRELEQGGCRFPPMHLENPIRTPSAVVRRAFYEKYGGFDPRFSHTADWEMWMRATVVGGAVAVNQPLAAYRLFSTNHSGRLARTADNLQEYVRLAQTAEQEGRTEVNWRQFRRMVATCAAAQAKTFAKIGDREAARANWRFWRRWVTWPGWLEYWGRRLLYGG
jgi:hypothetical protein